MRGVKWIFWNDDERRPRAGWRLLGQTLLLVALGAIVFALLTALVGVFPVLAALATAPVAVGLGFLALVASVWIAGRFLDHRPFADFGFHLDRDWWIDFTFGLVLATLLMAGLFFVQWVLGWVAVVGAFRPGVPGQPFVGAILLPLLLFIVVGIQEELLIRGYQLQNLAEGLNLPSIGPRVALVAAWVLSSIIFGLLHAANPNATPLSTINIVLAGLFLGLGYIVTGELAIPIGLHIAWNFVQGNVFGFPVSGTLPTPATFLVTQEQGPDIWTGGAFGPEGGLLVVPVLLIGSVLILVWVHFRKGRARLALSLPAPPADARASGQIAQPSVTTGDSRPPAA